MVFYVSGERDNSMKANHFGAIEDQDNEVTNQIRLRNEFGNP